MSDEGLGELPRRHGRRSGCLDLCSGGSFTENGRGGCVVAWTKIVGSSKSPYPRDNKSDALHAGYCRI